ncbi:hypothetical protein ACVWWN_007156 [Mycobacterium sp. URHB0021]|jgi:hypothetical protein
MQRPPRQYRREVVPEICDPAEGVSIRAGFSTKPRTTIAAACPALIGGTGFKRRDGAIIGVRMSGTWMLVNVM